MKKPAIIGLVVALTALSFVAGFFVHHHLHRNHDNGSDAPEVAKLKAELHATREAEAYESIYQRRPKLWGDMRAEETIQQLGYDKAYFFRWSNGLLDGWVEFDEADGPKRFPFDMSDWLIDHWPKEFKKPVAWRTYGNILLTLRRLEKSDEFDCTVSGQFNLENVDPSEPIRQMANYSKKGKVKLELNRKSPPYPFDLQRPPGSRWVNSPRGEIFDAPAEVHVDRVVNKKAVPWLSLKLVDNAK